MVDYTPQYLSLGTSENDGTGTKGRTGGDRINDNFTAIFNAFAFDESSNEITIIAGLTGRFRGLPISMYSPSLAGDASILTRYIAATAADFPANLAGSKAYLEVAPTSEITFLVQVNAVTKGDITFAASSNDGVFGTYAAFSLAIGDKLTLVNPAVGPFSAAELSTSLLTA